MPLFPNVESFILAGGKSSRMGRDKTLLELNGEPLVQRAANLLKPLVSKVSLVISAATPSTPVDTNRDSAFGLHIITDRWPETGPLGGIATALANAESPWCLILACDMPFLTKEWLTFLLGHSAPSDDESPAEIEVIIPAPARGLEPLCALYRSTCAPILAAALERGIRKVTDALTNLNLKLINEAELARFSPGGNLFGNLNTWQDYVEAQKRLKS